MISDIGKLQQDIRAIGPVTDSEAFLEGFLRAFGIPASTVARLKSTSSYHVNEGVRIGQATGVGRKMISNCVRHKCSLGGGYVWRLESDTSPFTDPKTNWDTRWEKGCSTAIPVDQIDLKTGACIATFRSIGEAAKSAGTYTSSIKQVIDHVGNHKSAGGYGWQYHNNP